jgi:hypothetical protein
MTNHHTTGTSKPGIHAVGMMAYWPMLRQERTR